jgi:integrase/recombinase XerD
MTKKVMEQRRRQAGSAIVVLNQGAADVSSIGPSRPESLQAWIGFYMKLEAGGSAANTVAAKWRDLHLFLSYFAEQARSDHPDQWTRSVTGGFLRFLERDRQHKPTSVNRVLASLRHCARWIGRFRPFLAGDPCNEIKPLITDEPEWKGLTDAEVVRLKSAAEQLVKLKARKNQMPVRDFAIFLLLQQTGLRVSELTGLDRRQYNGKHLHDVKRKGRVRTRQIFIPQEAREALDRYLADRPSDGPLFTSRTGRPIERQHVDRILKQIAAQANSRLPGEEKIRVSPHVLRHTFLRKIANEHGVQFALEAAGHSSGSKYIFRYIKPSEAEKETALENLF